MPDESLWRCPKCGRRWLDGHVVLGRRVEHARFRKIETFSARNHLHVFRLEHPRDVDATFVARMREAYTVGAQRHLHIIP
jgi:Zn-finger nucleic acid-binding protein